MTGLFGVFFAHVVEYVLYVLVVFDFFEKFVDGFALFGGNVLEVVGDALELGKNDFESVFLEVLLDI